MARNKKKGGKTKKILFAVEIIVLLVFLAGFAVYGQLMSRMDKTNTQKLDTNKIQVNQEVQDSIDSETSNLSGYTTYALFGIDARSKNMKFSGNENSDTMIIASVNNDTKEVKLVSIYRDTLLNLGNDTYSKANAAYAFGGPEQAITMLNTNLDLNITDYATVKFDALAEIIDDLGGLDMDMSYAEIVHMNNYCVETSEAIGKDYTPIELPEKPEDQEKIQYVYHLNGVQATSYCRIRYTASLDMGRTERQRKVIQMIVSKAKSAGINAIFKIMDDVFPMVTTSLDKTQILQMLPTLIGYSVDETTGFPTTYKFSNVKGSIIVATDLTDNVKELHKFLYGDESYEPSETVKANSDRIIEIVGGADKLEDTQAPVDETTENVDFVWDSTGENVDTGQEVTPDYNTGSDTSEGDTSGGDTSGGDTSGGDDYVPEPDTSGGDTSGGDTSGGADYVPEPDYGGDTSGGDTSGGDTSGGDTSGGDTSGGDTTGGDTGGGDVSEPDYGGDTGGGEEIVTESVAEPAA